MADDASTVDAPAEQEGVESTVEEPTEPQTPMIPKPRLDQVLNEKRALQEEVSRYRAMELELARMQAPQVQPSQPEQLTEDQQYFREQLAPVLTPLERQVQEMNQRFEQTLDKQEKQAFWSEWKPKIKDESLEDEVERTYLQFKAGGTNVSRQDVLAYVYGNRQLSATSEARSQAAQAKQAVQQANQIPAAEAGNQAVPAPRVDPSEQDLSKLSADELLDLMQGIKIKDLG